MERTRINHGLRLDPKIWTTYKAGGLLPLRTVMYWVTPTWRWICVGKAYALYASETSGIDWEANIVDIPSPRSWKLGHSSDG